MIRSKYKIPQRVFIILFCLLFLVAPFLLIDNKGSIRNGYLLFFLPVLSYIMLYSLFAKSPRIILDENFLTIKYLFKSKSYTWSSVSEIYLGRKANYMMQSMEATYILFDNGEKLYIWQDVYRNTSEMRGFIAHRVSEKIQDPRPNIILKNIQSINRRRYSGNAYTSFNTLLIVGMAIFMGVLIKGKIRVDILLLVPIGVIVTMFFGFGTQMNYFIIDEGYLFIKNQFFPWVNRQIRLEDIVEVDIETPYRRSTGLRIITRDFNFRIYGAGSLRGKNWTDLMEDLKFIGIPVRDDR